ncbi:GGDEF domain-containing protein [Deinococcus koreensis]|uniref:GGDEF domain-containing protein n=1 Tax=Deinococcus koreensis TaxID=2054903 RepID=A0A2K3UZ86_9DEIO|nr:diguanylate cyclase [Deinococcus koreensis]PNY81849.1 GGDEF domain-containing protein [Deinococcus koreensis]
MLTTLFLNFCVLATCSYLLSLTYRSWPTERSGLWYVLRLAALATIGILLMSFPAALAPGVIADLRAVPFVFALLRYGPVAAVGVALPMALYRLELGGPGALVSLISFGAMWLVGTAAWFWLRSRAQRSVPRPPQAPWGESLRQRLTSRVALRRGLATLFTLAPNGVALLLLPGGQGLFSRAYFPVLALGLFGSAILSSIVSGRIRHLQVMQRWQTQALLDPLTGIANRRQFDHDLLSLAPDDAVVLIDIDHFKRVNDTHGHAVGDLVLRDVAQTLYGQLRSHDQAYRIGGEEFAVILRGVTEEHGRGVAERLRRTVAGRPMAGEHITVSLGVSLVGESAAQDVLEQVDVALYRAKQRGRNRTCVWKAGQLTLLETARTLAGSG